ncbi:MAPEG family protein [Terrarubrum flagellatum]|uniref:MAPEG family protein n=1 Tax=Terrirubrum flagellatum TaxID=2895980 RepID=UPI003144DE47
MNPAAATTEISVLGWSVLLLLVQIVAQTLSLVKDAGLGYAMSPRDANPAITDLTKRLTHALRNFAETYAAFVGLALALVVTGKAGGLGATGALVWFWARVIYVPLFAIGVPGLRTAVWTVSIVGLVLMLIRLTT